jgi:hypothetical protein
MRFRDARDGGVRDASTVRDGGGQHDDRVALCGTTPQGFGRNAQIFSTRAAASTARASAKGEIDHKNTSGRLTSSKAW